MQKLDSKSFNKLSKIAKIYSLMSIYFAKSGHPGGVLSCIDIVLYIYLNKLKINKLGNFKKTNRDRLVLSKGHSVPAIYGALAALKILNFKNIFKLRNINSIFQGHPCRIKTPWVEASTGSLGQGFSFAIGQALALKHKKKKNKVFVIIGDGEMQEGQIWEGLLFAAHHKLNNLITILDYNKLQSDNFNKKIMNIEPLRKKILSFNWNVNEIDGHSFNQIKSSLNKSKNSSKPLFIIAHTIKGNSISFMKNNPLWHGSVKMSSDQICSALNELGSDNFLINMCKKYD
jgi:transketolase